MLGRTSLGKEGAEAMVGVGLLALFCKKTIGLGKIDVSSEKGSSRGAAWCRHLPGYRVRGSKAEVKVSTPDRAILISNNEAPVKGKRRIGCRQALVKTAGSTGRVRMVKLTSQQELAIWQPA